VTPETIPQHSPYPHHQIRRPELHKQELHIQLPRTLQLRIHQLLQNLQLHRNLLAVLDLAVGILEQAFDTQEQVVVVDILDLVVDIQDRVVVVDILDLVVVADIPERAFVVDILVLVVVVDILVLAVVYILVLAVGIQVLVVDIQVLVVDIQVLVVDILVVDIQELVVDIQELVVDIQVLVADIQVLVADIQEGNSVGEGMHSRRLAFRTLAGHQHLSAIRIADRLHQQVFLCIIVSSSKRK